jgi:peptide deformylase
VTATVTTDAMVDLAADAFAAALVRWRAERGLSKKQLAAEMGFDPSYVSHVEARRHRPTEDFARRAEAVLAAGGDIWQRFREYDQVRHAAPANRPRPEPTIPEQWRAPTTGLVVEHEDARLSYVDGGYRCVIRRDLFNAGRDAITRYLVRIAVDRYPSDPERSSRHYLDHPLTWAELNLDAHRGDEPMAWRAKDDRNAFKELWLLFENDEARFPLYPGERTTIEYVYTVGDDKWGQWFQRVVRLPTRRLSVRLDFPTSLRPVVWGVESSLTAEATALRSPVLERVEEDRTVFEWSTEDLGISNRYRLEWRFRPDHAATARAPRTANGQRSSDQMRAAGILQRGAPMLERAARWFGLPEQSDLASDVVERLTDAFAKVSQVADVSRGVGLSAPQIGIDWAAAVVRPPDDGELIVLLNPRVVGESVDHDEGYEGCLSFYDVRGLVSRPLLVEVEHEGLDGVRTVTTFTGNAARLVAHEVDHLSGLLYSDRMPPDGRLVPVDDYPAGPPPPYQGNGHPSAE